MTSSLANFVSSLVAGGLVVVVITIALVIISKSDRVTRAQIIQLKKITNFIINDNGEHQ